MVGADNLVLERLRAIAERTRVLPKVGASDRRSACERYRLHARHAGRRVKRVWPLTAIGGHPRDACRLRHGEIRLGDRGRFAPAT